MDERERITKLVYRQAVMITLSLGLAIFFYGGIGYYAVWTGHPASSAIAGTTYRLFQLGAFMIGALAIAGSRLLTGRMLSAQSSGTPGERHPKQLYLSTIVQCSAAELPVFLALVLLFLSRDIYGFIPFAVFSLAALAVSFPRKQKWVEWLGYDF
jgi:hypothetical protein